MELKRVVVTGLGALTPLGKTVSETWNNLTSGISGAAPITNFDATHHKTKFACEVKNFDPTEYMDRKDARKMDRFCQFAVIAADEAVKDAGLDAEGLNPDRIGVIWGAGIGGIGVFEEEVTNYATGNGTPRFNPFFIPKMIVDISAGHISMKYGFRGPNFSTVSACASSTNALIDAFNYIRLGKADAFVTGGSEAAITAAGIGGFNAMKALSERNDSPETASRPFDAERDGFVMGEGGAGIILEEYEHAKARGAKIYAEMVGGGMSADAHHLTAPHPEGLGASNVMINALSDAEMKPEEVDYVNVHGTSTPLGDVGEIKAVKTVFGEHAYKLNVSSTKSMTGHECWMAGASELIYSTIMMENSFVAPNINFENPDEDSKKINIVSSTLNKKIDIFLSNSFGFGGTNSALIVKKFKK